MLAVVKVSVLLGMATMSGVASFIPFKATSSFTRRQTIFRLHDAPEPLATEGDWTAYLDEATTGLVYYFNGRTGESLWEPPTNSFPVVVLPRPLRRRAERKRSEYIKSLQDKEARQEFPESDIARSEEEAREKQEKKQRQKDDKWFDFLFEEEPEPEPNWFESVSSVFAARDEPNGKQPEPWKDRGAPVNGDVSDDGGGTAVVEKPKPAKKPARKDDGGGTTTVVEKKPSLFERLTKPNGASPAPVAEPVTEKKPGFLEQLATAAAAASSVVEQPDAGTATTTTVEKKVTRAPARTFPVTTEPEALPEVIVEEPVVTPIKIEAASCVLPHPAKMFWGGEDAVFTSGRTFGVFDGVTGADKKDGVPLYSKMLATEMRKAAKSPGTTFADAGMSVLDLQRTLQEAREKADTSSTGASTAIVASITQDGFLRALNLGDSACVVVRNGRLAARTREISHYFDCPYQLSADSPDKPRDGTKLNIELVRGDVIVMASDGVFDNLENADIVELVVAHQEKKTRLSTLAKKIADRSRRISLSRQSPTPYAKQAKRNGDTDYASGLGGKVDDVSCVVVRYA